jgi:hypothetical protein
MTARTVKQWRCRVKESTPRPSRDAHKNPNARNHTNTPPSPPNSTNHTESKIESTGQAQAPENQRRSQPMNNTFINREQLVHVT